MSPKLFVSAAMVAGLVAAATATATPMLHIRGSLRTDHVTPGIIFPGGKLTDPSNFWDGVHGSDDRGVMGRGRSGFQPPPSSEHGMPSVPEPATLTLLAMGLAALAVARRRSRTG
jgi:PEP-CTERM motif